jgi:hypothetical protein
VIPVPRTVYDGAEDDTDDDLMDLGEEEGLEVGAAGGFLAGLEPKALSRYVLSLRYLLSSTRRRFG